MNHNQVKNAYVHYNQIFINKTLKDIFSQDICGKYSNFPPEHNKNLINRLINEKNGKLKKFFSKSFNVTFKEVINHIRGKEEIRELKGLKNLNQIIKKYKSEPDYLKNPYSIIKKVEYGFFVSIYLFCTKEEPYYHMPYGAWVVWQNIVWDSICKRYLLNF